MPTRYKIIGETGADDNDGRGYSKAQANREAEEWEDTVEGPVEIVPLDGPWRIVNRTPPSRDEAIADDAAADALIRRKRAELSDARARVRSFPSVQSYATPGERNLQIERDPQVVAARERLDAAQRVAIRRKIRTAEARMADAERQAAASGPNRPDVWARYDEARADRDRLLREETTMARAEDRMAAYEAAAREPGAFVDEEGHLSVTYVRPHPRSGPGRPTDVVGHKRRLPRRE